MSTRVDRATKLIETETIDEQFHQKAVINYKINMAFRTLLQEVSIECAFNDYKNYKVTYLLVNHGLDILNLVRKLSKDVKIKVILRKCNLVILLNGFVVMIPY